MSQTPTINGIGNARPHLTTPTPEGPPRYVHRQRLNAELDAATHGPVTLVSAPAGWGKSVALSAWARTRTAGRVVWLDASAADHAEMLRLTLDRFTDGEPDPAGPAEAEGHRRRAGEPSRSSEPLVIVLDDCDRDRRSRSAGLDRADHRRPATDGCMWCSPAGPTRCCRCTGGGSAATFPRSEWTSWHSPSPKRPNCWPTTESSCRIRTWPNCTPSPRVGRPGCGWPPWPWRTARIRHRSSPTSASTTRSSDYVTAEVLTPLPADLRDGSWSTSPWSSTSRRASCGPSPGAPMADRCWPTSSGAASSSAAARDRASGSTCIPLLGRVLYRELRQRGRARRSGGPRAGGRVVRGARPGGGDPAPPARRRGLAAGGADARAALARHSRRHAVARAQRGRRVAAGRDPGAATAGDGLRRRAGRGRRPGADAPVPPDGLRPRRPAPVAGRSPIATAFDLADARFTGDMARLRELAATLWPAATVATANGNGVATAQRDGTAPTPERRLAEETRAVAWWPWAPPASASATCARPAPGSARGSALTRQIDLARAEVTRRQPAGHVERDGRAPAGGGPPRPGDAGPGRPARASCTSPT